MKRITVSDSTYEDLYELIVRLLEGGKVQPEDKAVFEQVLRSYTNLNNVSTPKKRKAEGGQAQPKTTENGHAEGIQNGNRMPLEGGQHTVNGQQNQQPVQHSGQAQQGYGNGQNGQQGGVR